MSSACLLRRAWSLGRRCSGLSIQNSAGTAKCGKISPQRIGLHNLHEIVRSRIQNRHRTSSDACIRKEDVKPAILLQHLVDEFLDVCFLACIDSPGVHFNIWVQTFDFAGMDVQQVGLVVTNEDCFGAVAGELM